MKPRVLVIVGPTASGKSDLAVRLAKKFDGEIISADSRQVYRGLDVGTGKITKKEMRSVPHHLLDVADPKDRFSAADYKRLATNLLRYIVVKKKLPIIVGGTGFYIDALSRELPNVPPNKLLRKKLEKLTKEELYERLKAKDRRRAREIDKNNKVRLIRALEIIDALGMVPKARSKKLEASFIWIGLKPKDLEKRIHERLLKRIPGIIRETKKLSPKRAYELGLEYRYASWYLQGKLNKADMVNKLYKEIRRYSKRQMTWFKRNKSIKWFDSPSAAFRATIRRLEAPRNQAR
jgi:tRNA dimethylallyltransferase